jgi:hypothetical protein
LIVVDHLLVEGRADSLGDAPMYLAVNNQRIDQTAAVFRHHETVNAHLIGLRVDLDSGDVAG